jgi:uncharacterized protein YjbI with pentapeptide repeats
MHDDDDIIGRRELLRTARRTLSHYLYQLRALGREHAPPGVIHGIYEMQEMIQRYKVELRAAGVPVDDRVEETQNDVPQLPARQAPRQSPAVPTPYIERSIIERKLQSALIAKTNTPVVLLSGHSGTGKSSLVAQIAHTVADHFPGGTFWGDLTNLNPNDQFLAFLATLNSDWSRNAPRQNLPLRNVFWDQVLNRGSQTLVILDNVKDTRQAYELLPKDVASINQCRIILISMHRLQDLHVPMQELHLSYFSEKESETFFRKILPAEKYRSYQEPLREISRRLDHVPQLLVAAAKEFSERNISPAVYVVKLRQEEGQNLWMSSPIADGLSFVVHDLPDAHLDIFDTIGALGEGSWSIAMLAAVALRKPADVRAALEALVERDLVKALGDDRYHTNAMARSFARKRFEQRTNFVYNAAFHLLAHHCLNLANDLALDIGAEQEGQTANGSVVSPLTPEFVQAFRARLLPERSHVQHVLNWAIKTEQWDIVLRFAAIAYLELHQQLMANSFEIRKVCHLATLVEPVIWQAGSKRSMRVLSYGPASEWHVNPAPDDNDASFKRHLLGQRIECRQERAPDRRCELSLDLTACQVIDGVFDSMCLVDTSWAGIRAQHLICKKTDIVGGRFVACDLSHSIWSGCDARRVVLHHCNLRHAVLSNVRMRGADLQGADLTHAVLERVDLRGADLRGANFTGAVLDHVDLRGADLRGANFSLILPTLVELDGCRIDDSCWAGALIRGLAIKDLLMVKEIELASHEAPDPRIERVHRRLRPTDAVRTFHAFREGVTPDGDLSSFRELPSDLAEADMRGFDLETIVLSKQHVLRGADLRGACLARASLREVSLNAANLRAADLSGAHLSSAHLYAADLSVAQLHGSNLARANLAAAILRSAYLADADLSGADLHGAQMQSADATNAKFDAANLTLANLSHADCAGSHLRGAELIEAQLAYANLSGADFTDAILRDAICLNTSFRGATITERQLAQAARLDAAILPDGTRVMVLDEHYDASSSAWTVDLRFAHFDGAFEKIDLSGCQLTGAHLDGSFVAGSLAAAELACARLAGHFAMMNFQNCTLTDARLSGTFFRVDFGEADFEGVILAGATLVDVDLSRVRNLSDAQLRQAHRLQAVQLPHGMYDGRFDRPGDRDAARFAGVDPDDPAAMAQFLASKRPRARVATA